MGAKKEGKTKTLLKKFWFLLWKDNSIKGWLFSIIFLFVLIKFIFLPGLSLVTGTSLPLAIVESCSMYHQGNVFSSFDNWFAKHNEKYGSFEVTKQEFQRFPMKSGFSKGDILFIVGADPDKLKVGDVILFYSGSKGTPIIHRIIKIEDDGEKIFSTIGDNNPKMLVPDNNPGTLIDEKSIKQEQLVGKAVFRIAPALGWVKLIFFEGFRLPEDRGFCQER
jgi:hypothetical protein